VLAEARAAVALRSGRVVAQDAMAPFNTGLHRFGIDNILAKLGCIRAADQVVARLL